MSGVLVTAEWLEAKGASTSPTQFLNEQFATPPVLTGDAKPQLAVGRTSALTNSAGIARFVLRFDEGPKTRSLRLRFQSGGVYSPETRVITLQNGVASVDLALDGSIDRTGVNGIGMQLQAHVVINSDSLQQQ